MKKLLALPLTLAMLGLPQLGLGDDFLSEPSKLQASERFGGDMVYFPDDVQKKLPAYDSIMVDEPIIFLADDSPYKGFKASDMAAVANTLRESFSKGLSEQKVSTGNYKVVDEPGPSVLYLRLALKEVYVKKKKRGLLSYTPVGIVAHGVVDIASDAIDKTTLVEMLVEAEMQDTQTGEVLFAAILDRGHRKAHHVKEEDASWDAPGAIAEKLGRRLACQLDNGHLPAAKQKDCLKEIPLGN